MNDTTTTPRWRRLLDGGHSWGSLEVSPTHYGVTRYRLVVFLPGISANDRALLRLWRAWPTWGLAAFVVLEILLVPMLGPVVAAWTSATVFLGSGAAAMAMTASHRGGVRTLMAIKRAGVHDPMTAERFVEFYVLARDLVEADQRLAHDEIDRVEHERLMWRIYDRMAGTAPARP